MTKHLPLLLTLALLLPGCATNPVSGREEFVLMSEEQELQLGQRAAAEVARQMPLLKASDPLVRYVDEVGQKLAAVSDRPGLFYRFHVVDDPTINAFALPGGYIYVARGLLNHLNSEAELAAVLGHEIGHVTARHAVQRYTQAQAYNLGMAVASIFLPIPQAAGQLSDLLALAVIQGYGREAELQSDELSLKYLARAGYDPRATIGILEMLKRTEEIAVLEKKEAGEKVEQYHGAFASHPETEKRIREAVAKAVAMQHNGGIVRHEAMLRHVEGYPYGDSPEQGAVVGNRFIHPDLGIQLAFPENWRITNTPQALMARVRKQDVYFQLQLKELVKRQSAAEVLASMFPKRHFQLIGSDHRRGFDHAIAMVTMSAPHVSHARIMAHAFRRGPRVFLLLMWSHRDAFETWRGDFRAIANSFRPYDTARDGDVPRIALHIWKRTDSWRRLAGKSGNMLGPFTAEKIAALNGMGIKERPKTGLLIKTVR